MKPVRELHASGCREGYHVSVSADAYERLTRAAEERGISRSKLIDLALTGLWTDSQNSDDTGSASQAEQDPGDEDVTP